MVKGKQGVDVPINNRGLPEASGVLFEAGLASLLKSLVISSRRPEMTEKPDLLTVLRLGHTF